jgi:hypothetical protein
MDKPLASNVGLLFICETDVFYDCKTFSVYAGTEATGERKILFEYGSFSLSVILVVFTLAGYL